MPKKKPPPKPTPNEAHKPVSKRKHCVYDWEDIKVRYINGETLKDICSHYKNARPEVIVREAQKYEWHVQRAVFVAANIAHVLEEQQAVARELLKRQHEVYMQFLKAMEDQIDIIKQPFLPQGVRVNPLFLEAMRMIGKFSLAQYELDHRLPEIADRHVTNNNTFTVALIDQANEEAINVIPSHATITLVEGE